MAILCVMTNQSYGWLYLILKFCFLRWLICVLVLQLDVIHCLVLYVIFPSWLIQASFGSNGKVVFFDRKVTDSSRGNNFSAKSREKDAYNKQPSPSPRKAESLVHRGLPLCIKELKGSFEPGFGNVILGCLWRLQWATWNMYLPENTS